MKKNCKKIFFIVTAMVLSATMALSACSDKGLKTSGFELGHYDGSDTSAGYDTELLYKNNSELWGGDSGVIWVSEEDGEKLKENGVVDKNGESLGGYFYQYMSSCGGVASYGAVIDEPSGLGQGATYFVVTRSPDLNDWEICGAVDSGMGLFVGTDEWMYDWSWAPEAIHLPWDLKDASGEIAPYAGKYMLYFSARTKEWTPELGELGAIYSNSNSTAAADRFAFGIAVSDSPVGPFRLVSSENFYGDSEAKQPITKDFLGNEFHGIDDGVHEQGVLTSINPTVMFNVVGESSGLTDSFTPIDCSPFIDDDGSMYLVFVKHASTEAANTGFLPANGNNTWGMRMIDPVTPDYSSIRKLVTNGLTDESKLGQGLTTQIVWKGDAAIAGGMTEKEALAKYPVWRDYPIYEDPTHANNNYTIVEGGECPYEYIDTFPDGTKFESNISGINDGYICEAPQLIKTKDGQGKAKYIITYSPVGVGWDYYDIKWAYSTTPLGTYTKPKPEDRFLEGYDEKTAYMTTIGHSQFIDTGEEIWFAHWEGDRPGTTNTNPGRIFACAQASWQYYADYDIYLPIGNGPSISLQALPSVATGYTNVASKATVQATNGIGDTEEYLNDGMVVTTILREGKEFAFKNSTVITLTFDTPVSVRGLLIYNAYDIDYAFGGIKNIQFTLAEKPTWYEGDKSGLTCYISDLGFTPTYIYTSDTYTSACTASVATFNEIKVNKIEIEITAAYGDNSEMHVSDIVVLGK